MNFKKWFFEAKKRKDYEKILTNILDLDSEEGINQPIRTLDKEELKDKIEDSGELQDLSPDKKDKIRIKIDDADSGTTINDLINIMIEE